MRLSALIGYCLLAANAFLLNASAQTIEFTAVIQPATLASFCQEETHYVTCTAADTTFPTGVLLKSSTINLDPLVGVPTEFTAVARGVTCSMWDVTSATPTMQSLVTCGTPALGCPVRLRVGPTGNIGSWVLFRSNSPDFAPLGSLGTLMLAPPLIFVGSGLTFGPSDHIDLMVPNDLSLLGLDVFFQGASRNIGPVGPWRLTNSVCLRLLPPLSVPCSPPGC